jgi:hypothetical protein
MCHNHATSQRKLLFINGNIHATFLLRKEGGREGEGAFGVKKYFSNLGSERRVVIISNAVSFTKKPQ